MVMTTLSAQQQAGMDKIKAWYADPRGVFRLMGPAGTGKTTMAKQIPEALGLTNVVYGTYTGKAAHVLRSKGASPVSTIHSAIYTLEPDPLAIAALREAEDQLRDATFLNNHTPEILDRIAELNESLPKLRAAARKVSWVFNEFGPWAEADLILLDEVSMVDRVMAEEIESYGVPVLVLGDPAQLPPVKGEGFYVNGRPDVLLTEVHRQALESPVLALATRIREAVSTGPLPGLVPDDCRPASIREAMEHDQIICWSNKQRWVMTNAVRRIKGYPDGKPTPGDKIMCLTNNRDLGVFNGEQFVVAWVQEDAVGWTLGANADDGFREVKVFRDGFLGQDMQVQAKDSGLGQKGGRMLATFSWVITCHKAQGSEWNSVYVVNEMQKMFAMETRRRSAATTSKLCQAWLYTAVTRAADKVTITAPRR